MLGAGAGGDVEVAEGVGEGVMDRVRVDGKSKSVGVRRGGIVEYGRRSMYLKTVGADERTWLYGGHLEV